MSTNLSALDQTESKFPNFAEGRSLPDFLRVCYSKWFWLLLGFVCMGSGFLLSADSKRTDPLVNEPRPVSIEDVQLGWRVVGENPLGPESAEAEPDAATWKKVVLHGTSANETPVEIEFLRSPKWITTNQVAVGESLDLELSERHLSGVMRVVAIAPCPEIKPGVGPVVTGLFRHRCNKDDLVKITFDSDTKPIVGTHNHPFWSETRQAFVDAIDLQVGEQLKSFDESVVRVGSVNRLANASPVFNLETHNHHIYTVGETGMLVHNVCRKAVNPDDERLLFKEPNLKRSEVDSKKPFSQAKSDKQPITIVEDGNGNKFIVEGNRRMQAAREENLSEVIVEQFTVEEFEKLKNTRILDIGVNDPVVDEFN